MKCIRTIRPWRSCLALLLLVAWIPAALAATSYSSDLQITLVNGSTSVQLFAGAGDASLGDLNTIFDDESLNSPSGSAPFPADMQPVGSLSDFDNIALNAGTWELHILDPYVPNEGDDLIAWSLSGTSNSGGFNYAGPAAFGVDTDPATIVTLDISDARTITDLNVYIHIGNDFPEVPLPASVWLFGSGLLGLLGMARRKLA